MLTPSPQSSDSARLALPVQEGWIFEPLQLIRYCQADGNYARFHFADGREKLITRSLTALEQQLTPRDGFIRIHRSFLLNLAYLQKFIRAKHPILVLDNGTELPLAVSRRSDIHDLLLQHFRF